MTLAEFIAANSIKAFPTRQPIPPAPRGESKDDKRYRESASHWVVTLQRSDSRNYPGINIPYSMGSAHTKPPDAAGVLECIQSDCSSIENARDFDDWASDFGYDTDSRKAERIYRACQDQTQLVRSWLGRELYNQFLDCRED